MNRREFLSQSLISTAALAAYPFVMRTPAWAQAAAPAARSPIVLKAVKRVLEIDGRAANVFGLVRADSRPGLELDAGSAFDVVLGNELTDPTLIHWHGLTPPWLMDGVPDTPAPLLKPGETRRYTFPVGDSGTYWMHAHSLQEQNLLAAPLIVHSPTDASRDEQEVVVLLHDFSFTPAEALLDRLKSAGGPMGMMMGGTKHDAMMGHMARMRRAMMENMESGQGMASMGGMDVNDIQFDAFLANDRTMADPEVVRAEPGGRLRLRIINGAAATAFTIDTGRLGGELIAVDGQDVVPIKGVSFPIAMGQRLDIRVALPKEGGTFPILALREGARERAGILLATPFARIVKLPTLGGRNGPTMGLSLESRLRAARPLTMRAADRLHDITLAGSMTGYSWSMEEKGALKVKPGDRVEITMHNMSMMLHPMHLHGHRFQVVGLNGRPVRGAVRDTVAVPPMASVTIAFDASNIGRWAFHCHHLYHMAAGMMTFVDYDGSA